MGGDLAILVLDLLVESVGVDGWLSNDRHGSSCPMS
jgi:hypothetical protein